VLECTAFQNSDQSLVVVVMNRSEAAQAFTLKLQGRQWDLQLPPRSIASYLL